VIPGAGVTVVRMGRIAGTKAAIGNLGRKEFRDLETRLDRPYADDWDGRIETDAQPGGPLDRLAEDALSEYRTGRCEPLP